MHFGFSSRTVRWWAQKMNHFLFEFINYVTVFLGKNMKFYPLFGFIYTSINFAVILSFGVSHRRHSFSSSNGSVKNESRCSSSSLSVSHHANGVPWPEKAKVTVSIQIASLPTDVTCHAQGDATCNLISFKANRRCHGSLRIMTNGFRARTRCCKQEPFLVWNRKLRHALPLMYNPNRSLHRRNLSVFFSCYIFCCAGSLAKSNKLPLNSDQKFKQLF